ncbi:MAG: Stp1/IreP family PP2C-type Ser/Thr phosphatase [Gammaproteobacteria bacterium]|nr:Stp1/IreP family PP2C-type Ser/Thr phosphatase [Gammaproteobacteria bacterium]MDH3464857.1 Stp1/IreP family PP2C-type Ser/Thr phosphatase [Gammaproteobacteria bacterium]
MYALEGACASDTGRVREHNEDSTAAEKRLGLFIVADGMGGYRAGEVASAFAVTTMVRSLRRQLYELDGRTTSMGRAIKDALLRANDHIFRSAQSVDEYRGMGTTIASLLFHDDDVCIAHVGDCRAYRLRDGELRQLTTDHTVHQELIDRGLCTPEEAAEVVSRSVVTRALGIDATVNVDVSEQSIQANDMYLLCSDGLTDMIDDEMIRATLQSNKSLNGKASSLVELANDCGGQDNVSVVLVRTAVPLAPY